MTVPTKQQPHVVRRTFTIRETGDQWTVTGGRNVGMSPVAVPTAAQALEMVKQFDAALAEGSDWLAVVSTIQWHWTTEVGRRVVQALTGGK